ncbi:MAG TPA: oxygen-dependent coproporphyrinogen oxidase [Bacteroidota bacterium]|nr:oxygen-dependent coproporphyrinogen oxidase [Bacteroidota bacterium]
MKSESLRDRTQAYFRLLQTTLCSTLESADAKATFIRDDWSHEESGGGTTRVLENGQIFEKAAVNFSAVTTNLSVRTAERMNVEPQAMFAAGISLVLHPGSPMIPTVHMNLRYIEPTNGEAWFGGGMDLTPYYLFEEDVRHFHQTLRQVCDRYDHQWYPRFKKWCDEYFTIAHRCETRGLGGIFFDYLRGDPEATFAFVQNVGGCFLNAYLPIVQRRKSEHWGTAEKEWQLHRRGRYVEFNLIYDRGTLFGLETRGRIESILISLPPSVHWKYNFHPLPGSREQQLLEILQQPQPWA